MILWWWYEIILRWWYMMIIILYYIIFFLLFFFIISIIITAVLLLLLFILLLYYYLILLFSTTIIKTTSATVEKNNQQLFRTRRSTYKTIWHKLWILSYLSIKRFKFKAFDWNWYRDIISTPTLWMIITLIWVYYWHYNTIVEIGFQTSSSFNRWGVQKWQNFQWYFNGGKQSDVDADDRKEGYFFTGS